MRRLVPSSITTRLALASAVLILLAVVLAGAGTAFTMHRFIRSQIDQRLDAQLTAVAAALTIVDGRLVMSRPVDTPPFDRLGSGWLWEARLGDQILDSRSMAESGPPRQPGADEGWFSRNWHDRARPWHGDIRPEDRAFSRTMAATVDGQSVSLTASAPYRALVGPMMDMLRPVAGTMLLLGLCLTLAAILQLRAALRPLARLQRDVETVRAGRATALPQEQPKELTPLVGELNRLITQNAEGLARARGHVSNLGHALNTQLASLALALAESPNPEDAKNLELVRRMQDRIRHHLGRARAAALGGPSNVRTDVAARVADIASALGKIHIEKGVAFAAAIPPGCAVACEAQDFDEMAGNLLDNAFKWARGRVALSATRRDARIEICIDDDGTGLPEDMAPQALMPGRRLDEQTPGTGFGLPIARELADLYGGDLRLERSPLGGLRAVLTLPA